LDIGNVGISFAAKKKLFDDGHIFIPSGIEDYTYLNDATNKKYNIMISPHVTYFVRNYDNIQYQDIGERLCLYT
jgi:hypothetical protein